MIMIMIFNLATNYRRCACVTARGLHRDVGQSDTRLGPGHEKSESLESVIYSNNRQFLSIFSRWGRMIAVIWSLVPAWTLATGGAWPGSTASQWPRWRQDGSREARWWCWWTIACISDRHNLQYFIFFFNIHIAKRNRDLHIWISLVTFGRLLPGQVIACLETGI